MNAGPRVLALLLYLLLSAPLRAQSASYIVGRVLDPSDAVVPGASITVVNQETGFRRVTETGLDGTYAVGSLQGGMYKVTVRRDGFVGMIRFDVKVPALQSVRVDFKLTVGSVQETITVEGTAPLLTADDTSIGVRVFHDDIRHLPNERGVLGLVELAPGTNVTPATRGESGQFTANGQRPNANYFTVDGASANTGVLAGGLPAQATGGVLPAMSAIGSLDSLLPVEAIDEFRVQTANTPGDLGRLPGANVSLTSRSGSNELHGSLVYRFRHEALAANDWFANYSGSGSAPLRLHDIAPSLGGPIHRNHTFFFLSYQHTSLRGPYVSRQPVPSLDTRAAAPDWIRPGLDLYPVPNGASLGNGLSAWYGRNIRPSELDSGVARVDHALTTRSTLFTRYNDSPSTNQFGSTQINRLDLRFRSLTLGLNYRRGARLTFDVRANESESEASSTWSRIGGTTGGCDLEPLTSYLFPNVVGACNDLVRFSIGGVGQVINGREGDRRQRQFQLVESTGLTIGPHTIRLGVDYRRIVPIRRDANGALSVIADDITGITEKRNLWLGTAAPVNASTEVKELSLWVQDTWQISSRLMITPGLRWEYNPSPMPSDSPWFLDPATNIFNPEHRPLWPVSYTNFAPRLSAVWRVTRSGNTVLRGGGGIFYDSSLSIATDLINSGPLGIQQLISGRAGFFSTVLSYGFDPALRLPRLAQWNLTLDRALSRNDALSIGYVGSKGRRFIRRELGGLGNTPTAIFALTTNHGSSDYEGLQVQYRRRVAHGVQALASYSWSHSLDNDSSDSFLVWAAAGATASRDHASSDFDLRHSLSASVTWDAPRRWGGWSLDSMLRSRTGFPITVLVNEQYQGVPLANAFRPDRLLNEPLWIDDPTLPGGRRINAAAFVAPAAGKQGSLGRNSIIGFGMSQLDLAVRREWKWKERRTIEARLEAFNALNEANFADPVHYMSSPVFGQSTSMLNLMLGTGSPGSGLSPLLQTGGARNVQGSVRFRF
jgi:hypothetical protein